MVAPNDKNKTPVRDRKVGLADNNAPVNPNGVPQLVEKMVRYQNPSLFPSSGSSSSAVTSVQQQQPIVHPQNVFQSGGVSGRFEQPVTNFTQMQPQVNQGGQLWYGAQTSKGGFANPSVGPVQSPYMNDAADTTPQPQSNFENMPSPSTGWNADGSARNDELSSALSGFQYIPQYERVPEFQKDDTKRDGGFFSFLKGLMPKSRPGMRADETPDEYDERTTRNKERLAALADFMRHAGNIYNTSRYAPSQQFNDPTAKMEADLQNRKAQRRQKEAMDMDAAYKQANLSMKERAAEADRQYKEMSLGLKQRADERAAQKQKDDADRWNKNYERQLSNDKFNQGLSERRQKESERHNKVAERQGAQRIAVSMERNNIARARLAHSIATSGSGSGGRKGGSLTNLSTPKGHTNRPKDLNAIEKKQLTQYLIKNGYINKDNMKAYNDAKMLNNMQSANDLVNYWIAYAANMGGQKGERFRKVLRDHYGYSETTTTTVQQPSKPKSVVTITSKGNKGAKAASPTKKGFKGHVD